MRIHRIALAMLLLASCKQSKSKLDDVKVATPAVSSASSGSDAHSLPSTPITPPKDISSKDVLARATPADEVYVKWVVFSWKDVGGGFPLDPRAKDRSNDDAAKLALDTLAKLKADPTQIDALVKSLSEQPGGADEDPVVLNKAVQVPPPFKPLIDLSMRLNVNEAGIVQTPFGYQVVERIAPPPLDPLESAAILARPASDTPVAIQFIVLGWKDMPSIKRALDHAPPERRAEIEAAIKKQLDPRTFTRTKADADKLASDLLAKANDPKTDFAALVKQNSEEPSTKNGRVVVVDPDGEDLQPFEKLGLRLKDGEAGLVVGQLGWHVVKRVAMPPPDSLESVDILARKRVTDKAKVKHILLAWKDLPPFGGSKRDPRADARSRADLEKLVTDTVAKAKGGAKFEDLMKQLSEDPGSAKTGESYDVTPDAQLVDGFKKLSLRLNVGEVGVVKTEFGIHIIKRVE